MKILVILAHPNKRSFNHAIAAAVIEILNRNDHEVIFHDLYEERFDPVLPFYEIPKDVPPPLEIHEGKEKKMYSVTHSKRYGKTVFLVYAVSRTSIGKCLT